MDFMWKLEGWSRASKAKKGQILNGVKIVLRDGLQSDIYVKKRDNKYYFTNIVR